jgi:hypothetical protein
LLSYEAAGPTMPWECVRPPDYRVLYFCRSLELGEFS